MKPERSKVRRINVRAALRFLFGAAMWGLPGCTTAPGGPYAPQVESERDTARSESLARQGADALNTDPERAERLLREALAADLYNGPAHNNLGVLYLNQGKLYEAAGECEFARKLMPGAPDPRLNLAIALERAGRTKEALETYRTALEVYPGHIQSMQAIARMQVRTGQVDDTTHEYLREIAFRGDTPQWRGWAAGQLAGR